MTPRTLPEALERAAHGSGAFIYRDEQRRERVQSYRDLFDAALRVGGALRDRGLSPGDRVVLVLPDPEPFLTAFLGASVAGLTPVPIYPPLDLARLGAYLDHARHVFRAADPRAVITTPSIRRLLGAIRAETPRLLGVFAHDELTGAALRGIERPSPSDVVFIQFTSGSTAAPKGVALSHDNLAANVAAFGGPAGLGASSADVGVSWLPLFHDMGLIGMALGSLWFDVTTVILSPRAFLRRPVEWLRAISDRRGTISFAPNFAYAYCARRVRADEAAGLDLSSWRVAGCGAEPIHAATLLAFADRFASAGFRRTALLPCYGLAEHTLAVTFPRGGAPLRVDTVDGSRLAAEGVAAPCEPAAGRALSFVCCGRPFPGHDVRIVDADGVPLPDRAVGEILLRGPSVMKGYEADAHRTGDALRGGWLSTGDLGYTDAGELFVCGRKKDVIIVNGRNHHPQDLEWAISDLPGVRRGGVVAFGTGAFSGGAERIVIVAETKGTAPPDDLAREIRRHAMISLGLRVHEVVIAPRGTIPKTSSGKPQRARTRALYEAGKLLEPERNGTMFDHLVASQWGHLKAALRQRLSALR